MRRRLRCAPGAALAALALLAGVLPAGAACAAPVRASAPARALPFAPFVAEAALRFALPEHWIWAVMRAESAGDPRAISSAGAMGLMQVMPRTWAELRVRYALGRDPFDPRDNIMAGAAYMREMLDRFGAPGFLAAYNAGPARYADYVARGRPLPRETIAYEARLAPAIGAERAPLVAPSRRSRDAWMQAGLFISRSQARAEDVSLAAPPARPEPARDSRDVRLPAPSASSAPDPDTLFVARTARSD